MKFSSATRMTDTSQGAYSQSMYRSSNFSSRYPEYLHYNVWPRRSALNGIGGGSFGMNRRQFAQRNHSYLIPELVRETGLILEVQREYGRILSQSNFSTPNIHIFFSLSTLVNDSPLSVITDNLADIFQAGAVVEIEVEGGVNLKELKDHVHVILTCTSIKPSTETGRNQLVPMIIIQDDREIPLALIANHELVALPRQVFPVDEVTSAFMAKKSSVTTDVGWPEFATIGRSIEGRIVFAPPWTREFTNPACKRIALSVQRFGRDREGFAVIKEYIGRGVILAPIDEEDKKICGDLFFPYEMQTNTSYTECEVQDAYRLGSKWYFRACPELPNRKYKYRVYSLSSLDNVISGDLITQERFSEQTVNPLIVTNQGSVAVDVSTGVLKAGSSTNNKLDDSNQLIEFDNKSLPVSSPNSLPKAAKVSQVTLDLLSAVNDASCAATASGINETMVLQSSNSTDMTDCNLLVDFSAEDEVQEVATQFRRFHTLDEDFTLSSFNFDFKNTKEFNYKTKMSGCNNHENHENTCMESQCKESENADLDHINNGLNTPKEQLMKMRNNDYSVELSEQKYVENCSVLFNRNSVFEQLIDINSDSPIIDQEMDTSDDDSENEMFHAVSVKKQDDDGWWFTRKFSNSTDSTKDKKTFSELTRLSYFNGNSEAVELNSVSKNDNPLLVLPDNRAKNYEATSMALKSQASLPNALQNDGIYAKFFAELFRK